MAVNLSRETYTLLGFNAQGDLGGFTMYTSRRGRLVVFKKSPPMKPPSPKQTHQRNLFRALAALWKLRSKTLRWEWTNAERKGRLRMTGYNLWIAAHTTLTSAALATIARQTDSDLTP